MDSILLIALASFLNAVMDRLENTPNFNESVFRNWDRGFWCKVDSAKRATVVGYRLDGWHLAKSLMIISLCLAVVLYEPLIGFWDIALYGVLWCLLFELFYSYILKIKQ